MLQHLRIVLVATSHPGNIGAAARAMKTMGLRRLYLVAPKEYPSAVASARASGATDILDAATLCPDLPSALAGCHWVIGCSARERSLAKPSQSARSHAADCLAHIYNDQWQIAVVFGNEQSGLSNSELDLCHALLHIPSNKEYSSLNLAAAVQLVSYELFCAYHEYRQPEPAPVKKAPLDQACEHQQLQDLFAAQQQLLNDIGFLGSSNPEILLRRLQNLLYRAQPSQREVNILRGILSAIAQNLSAKK